MPIDPVDTWWSEQLDAATAARDHLRSAIEDLSDWYLQKDACSPGSVTSTLGVANDLQSLLHDPSTFQGGVNDDDLVDGFIEDSKSVMEDLAIALRPESAFGPFRNSQPRE